MNTTSKQNSTLDEDCSGALKNAEIVISSAMNGVLALISPSNAFVASMGVQTSPWVCL